MYAVFVVKDSHFGVQYALIGWTLFATASILDWVIARYEKSARSN